MESFERYQRQILLPEFGEEGQRRLRRARILIVGMGGLGSPAALYLARAGVGTLGLVDPDVVEISNLHRQVLFREEDRGRPKAEIAAQRLAAEVPGLVCVPYVESFGPGSARSRVREYDLVLDGTDNFPARYAVNDACVLEGRPNVHAAVEGLGGHLSVFATTEGPCYRCLFPEPPPPGLAPSCAEAGVLGPVAGLLGLWQAVEALKLASGIGRPLVGRLLRIDGAGASTREVRLRRDPDCPLCGEAPRIRAVESTGDICEGAVPVGGGAEQTEIPLEIDVAAFARRRQAPGPPVVLDVRLAEELAVASLDGPVVHIPLHELPDRLGELDSQREYVVLCHAGIRSWQAVQFLRARGFRRVQSLRGGIDQWAREVDPSVPRY